MTLTTTAEPRWLSGLKELARRYRQLAQARRTITPNCPDAVAEALDFVAGDLEAQARVLTEPTLLLTAAQWAAEQEPPVSPKTVRRWIRRGELEHTNTPAGLLIPAGARRIVRTYAPDPREPIAAETAERSDAPALAQAS